MPAYYNEIDPQAASWLRALISENRIAPGEVDERSIEDVIPSELMGYSQCHFFAGIGVWSHALRQAGWPDDNWASSCGGVVPPTGVVLPNRQGGPAFSRHATGTFTVWTGSCPCQPFSAAGKGGGTSDERHLWPAFFWLIRQCRPNVVIGEQVEAALRHDWLDHVAVDLEAEGYAVGAVSSPACGYGAPHIRQRLYWVAQSRELRWRGRDNGDSGEHGGTLQAEGRSPTRLVADASDNGHPTSDGNGKAVEPSVKTRENGIGELEGNGNAGILGDSESTGLQEQRSDGRVPRSQVGAVQGQAIKRTGTPISGMVYPVQPGSEDWEQSSQPVSVERGPTNGFWRDCEWIPCRDGKARPTGRGIHPLVASYSKRARQLRAQEYEDDGKDSNRGRRYDAADDGENNGGKQRGPTQPSPLALAARTSSRVVCGSDHGAPADEIDPQNTAEARVMRLRGYGNAIVAPQAAAFIKAYMEAAWTG